MSESKRPPARSELSPSPPSGSQPGGAAKLQERGGGRASFGQWLRTQREARGIELSDIADSSKISLRYLESLESDRFDVLPAPVFVRGFLREYARIVGLDPDEVVNLFLVSVPRAAPERRADATLRGGNARSRRPSIVPAVVVAAAIAALLAAAAGVSYWAMKRSSRDASAPSVTGATEQPSGSGDAGPGGSEETQGDAAPSAPFEEGPLSAEPSDIGADAIAIASPEEPAPPAGSRSRLVLVLSFQQDCWVETRVDGGRRNSELKAGGETMRVEADDAIVLTLGNVHAVTAELDGRPLALPSDETRLLREFRIDRSLRPSPSGFGSTPPSGP